MLLSSNETQTSPQITGAMVFNWSMGLLSLLLVGLIASEVVRLINKPTEEFQKFVAVANLSGYEKCLKNKGGEGCKEQLIIEWRKRNGN
jgi:hypothetical protein